MVTRIKTPDGYEAVKKTFGDITKYIRPDGTLRPEWEQERIVRIELPAPLQYASDKNVLIHKVAVHLLIADLTAEVFHEIHAAGKWKALENFGGGYNFRNVRGSTTKISLHAFGIAFDFDLFDNPLGGIAHMDPVIISLFEAHGFFWGGNFKNRPDPMHFQYAINC